MVDASQRTQMLTWLLLQPHTGAWKVDVLRGWGYETGVTLTAAEYRLAETSGVPTTPVKVTRE